MEFKKRIRYWEKESLKYPEGSQLRKSAEYIIWCLREQEKDKR